MVLTHRSLLPGFHLLSPSKSNPVQGIKSPLSPPCTHIGSWGSAGFAFFFVLLCVIAGAEIWSCSPEQLDVIDLRGQRGLDRGAAGGFRELDRVQECRGGVLRKSSLLGPHLASASSLCRNFLSPAHSVLPPPTPYTHQKPWATASEVGGQPSSKP